MDEKEIVQVIQGFAHQIDKLNILKTDEKIGDFVISFDSMSPFVLSVIYNTISPIKDIVIKRSVCKGEE